MSEPVFLTVMRIWRRKWRLLQAKTRPRVRRTSQNRPCLRKGAEVLRNLVYGLGSLFCRGGFIDENVADAL